MTERLPARIVVHSIPGGFVLIGLTWMIGHMQVVPVSAADFVKFAPYFLFAAGLLLSAVFHRSRVFHALLLLLACHLALVLTADRSFSAASVVLADAIGMVLPLNLVLIALLPETGITSREGQIRLGIFAAQALAIAIVIRYYAVPGMRFLERPLVEWLAFREFRGLPQSVLVAFVLGLLLLVLPLVRRRFRPVDVGLYWALVSGFVALSVAGSARSVSIAFSAGATVLLIALLESFYAMAYFDELTDLPSRRAFNDAKLRLGGTYTVAMVDVDHFKKFNDTYGHDAGDQVLRMVAARISEVSGGGKGYRYGGEEFAVLFPGKQVDESFPHLERLRRSIEELPFKLRSQERRAGGKKRKLSLKRRRGAKEQTNITVSIGVAGIEGNRRKPDDLVKAADTALYRAKDCGRNCTIIGDAETVTA